jgi:methylase of polypeptide subunit release factors
MDENGTIMNPSQISWTENEQNRVAIWQSEANAAPPKRVVLADDTLAADAAYRLVCEGVGLLWRGDFQNARQLLQALARRVDKARQKKVKVVVSPTEAFHQHRAAQIQRARILGLVLIEVDESHRVNLRRAPDVALALTEALGASQGAMVLSLRELQGLIGAHEWRKKGVFIEVLNDTIHPYYGVFSPVRGEYVELVARVPLPLSVTLAFDIGAGSGVLSAVLAKRGVERIVATDMDERALSCAAENLARMGLSKNITLQTADLFPPNESKAQLIVCNPPWLPAKANAPIEHAVYDPDSRMLKGFLSGLSVHLAEAGEGWLIMSDLAEHLGLRSHTELLSWIDAAGLVVLGKIDVKPKHGKVFDKADPLHSARAKEVTSLWRLGVG